MDVYEMTHINIKQKNFTLREKDPKQQPVAKSSKSTGENEKSGKLWGKKKQFMQSNLFLKLKIGALVHKIQYQKKDTPPALYDLVQPASAVHNYNTRYATNQNLCRPFSRTNYGLARFSVVASQTWEATPMKIKCLPLNSFKKEYKLFLYLTVKHLEQL